MNFNLTHGPRGGFVILMCAVAAQAQVRPAPVSSPSTLPSVVQDIEVTGDGPIHIEINRGAVPGSTTRPVTNRRVRIHVRSDGAGSAGAERSVNAGNVGMTIENPLVKLEPRGVTIFKNRNVDIAGMQKMKAVELNQQFTGSNRRDVVNDDPNLVVVLGKKFATHGNVQSAGPIVIESNNGVMGDVDGRSIVWFVGDAVPRGEIHGTPIIVGPGTFIMQGKLKSPEVWMGRYGWPEE